MTLHSPQVHGFFSVPVDHLHALRELASHFAEDRVQINAIIGDVAGRDVIVLDDEIAKGITVIELLDRLREQGVRSVRIACTHGLFAGGSLDRLAGQPDVGEIVCTNTVPIPRVVDKLTVLSVAPALAEAMRRIHNGESVSVLFG